MSLFVTSAQQILDRFEAQRQEHGFSFSPPDSETDLGEFAFPGDVFEQIFAGIIAGFLVEFSVALGRRFLSMGQRKEDPNKSDVSAILDDIVASTRVVQEGIAKLEDQGVNGDEARVAIDLLRESLEDVLKEQIDASTQP